ncbi:SGNH/GDSL hydrolase family protein [Agrobacterium sp. 22-3674b3]
MSVVFPITEDDRYRRYTASAGQTTFPIPFPFQQNDDIVVLLEVNLGEYLEFPNTSYSISGAGEATGGACSFNSGRQEGDVILVLGKAILDRLSSVVSDGRFKSALTDGELDRVRIIQQEQRREVGRAIKAEYGGPEITIKSGIQSGRTLVKDNNTIVEGPAVSEIENAERNAQLAAQYAAAAAAAGAAFIEFPSYAVAQAFNPVVAPDLLSVAGYYGPETGIKVLYERVDSGIVNLTIANGAQYRVTSRPFDVRMFGMRDGIDNDVFWENARLTCLGSELKVPAVTYPFADTPSLSGVKIMADDGALFEGPNIYNYGTVLGQSTVIAQGKLNIKNTGSTAWRNGFNMLASAECKKDFLTPGDADTSRPVAVNMATLDAIRVPWPNGDAWESVGSGMGLSDDAVAFNLGTIAGTNHWYTAGFVGPKAGFAYQADFVGAMSPRGIFIRTESEWINVWADDGGTSYTFTRRPVGGPTTQVVLPTITNGDDQEDFRLVYSSLGVHMLAPNVFCISINGVDVTGPQSTLSPIIEVLWGVYANAGAAGNVFLQNMVAIVDAEPPTKRGLRVLVYGDSQTDDINPSWVDICMSMLQGSLGLQIELVNNLAVAGENAAQQLARLQALGSLAGYNLALGMLATNDGQGQTDRATFDATITSILDITANNFIPTVLASSHQFYYQSNAELHGGVGQMTGNAHLVTYYRNSIAKRCAQKASNGFPVGYVDMRRAIPPMMAYHLDWDAAGSRALAGVFDNIHPDMEHRVYIAQAFARKIVQMLFPRPEKKFPLTLGLPGWRLNSYTGGSLYFGLSSDGDKILEGAITKTSAPVNGELCMRVPAYLRPEGRVDFTFVSNNGVVGTGVLDVNGEMTVYGVDATSRAVFLNLRYR